MFAIRWWTLDELERAEEVFAPRRLPELVRDLVVDGPPASPIDVGVVTPVPGIRPVDLGAGAHASCETYRPSTKSQPPS